MEGNEKDPIFAAYKQKSGMPAVSHQYMGKYSKKKEVKPKKRISIDAIVLASVVLGLVLYLCYKHREFRELNSDYKIAIGTIYEIRGIRSIAYYSFYVNGIKYLGTSVYATGNVGDTLQIRYYVPDPTLNRWEEDCH